MNERQIKLARLLIEHDTFLPASFYSKQLSVSTKTVFQDLEMLNLLMKPYDISIERLPSVGIRISGEHEAKLNFMIELENELSQDAFSPVNRRIEIIKKVCFEEEVPTLDQLSELFLVSKTSLYGDLKLLNQIIARTNSEIQSNNDGLKILGKESEIQNAANQLVSYFLNVLEDRSFRKKMSHFFDEALIVPVFDFLLTDFKELTEEVSEYYIQSLIMSVLIQCRRLELAKHLPTEEDYLFSSIRYMEAYVVANELAEKLSKTLDIVFEEADKEYLSRQLFAHRVTTDLKSGDDSYAEIVQRLIARMSAIEKIDLTSDQRLFNSLLYHIPAMILRLKKGIKIENPLLSSIRDQYSELFSIVWYALVILEQEYDVILNDDEISLILIHFQIALERQSKTNNIIIVCQYGISSAQFIYSKVRKFIPAHDNVEISTIDKFEKSDKENIDLIISSIDIPQSKIPFVKVTPLVNNQDYIKLMEAYTKYLIQGEPFEISHSLSEKVPSQILGNYLSTDLISLQNQYDDKESCLDAIIGELERRKLVNKNFRKSVFDREKIGNTNLDSGVALPHADPATIIVSHIYFVTLAKPVNWGDGNVKLIVMVNLGEADLQKIREVVEELYQFIDEKKKVDALVKITDKTSLLQIFNNGGT